MFIRGFMESRGSVDTTANYLSQDYFFKDSRELKKALLLYENCNIPLNFLNINFRNLQPQYVEEIQKRNTQFRMNCKYYANVIGFFNKYKSKIFKEVYAQHIEPHVIDNIEYYNIEYDNVKFNNKSFINIINFFTNYIYEKKLTKPLIEKYRNDLEFNSNEGGSFSRSSKLRNVFDSITEDKCALCNTTKTFTKKNSNKQYFEIHHVISLHKEKYLDNLCNLVKLCPTCHDSLKKNASSKDEQIRAIKKILQKQEIFDFCSAYFGEDDIEKLAILIWEQLG